MGDYSFGLRRRLVLDVGTALLAVVLLIAQGCQTQDAAQTTTRQAIPRESDEAASRAAFLAVYPVLMHPRCMNCHPKGDQPLQGDDSHIHVQNVRRGPDGKGLFAM